MKTESESIETAEVRDVCGTGRGRGLRRGAGQRGSGVPPAQDEGERRKTAEQRAECFMAKWIAAEKVRAGLRHAVVVVCPNVTGRTKDRIAQSKRARAGSLAIVDKPQVARTCILWAFRLFAFLWRYVCFVFLCFVFVFFCFH